MVDVIGGLFLYLVSATCSFFTAYGSLLCWHSYIKESKITTYELRRELRWPFTWLVDVAMYEMGSGEGKRALYIRGMGFRILLSTLNLIMSLGVFYRGISMISSKNIIFGTIVLIISFAMIWHIIKAWTFGKRLIDIEKEIQ